MSTPIRFIIFSAIIHILLIILSLPLLDKNPLYFLAAEVVILTSILFSVRLYLDLIKPVNLLKAGIESLKDEEFNTQFVKVGKPELDQLIDLFNTMMERLRKERTSQQEKHYFLTRLIEASPNGIIILDFDDRILMINPAAINLLQNTANKLSGKSIHEIEHPLMREMLSLQSGHSKVITLNGISSYKCHKAHFIDRGFKQHFILIEELTEQIIQSQKSAYEKVIRMMSHEINNSIGAVNSILDTLKQFTGQLRNNDRADYSNALGVAIERNTKLNRFMANFADVVRIPAPKIETIDLTEIINNIITIYQSDLERASISVDLNLDNKPFFIQADAQQMEQVFLNILKNAVEAINSNGFIHIHLSEKPIHTLRIIDSGDKLDPANRNLLFSPFFSTKKTGQGIGLTLSREILLNHGFKFDLFTNHDGHTEFKIALSTH